MYYETPKQNRVMHLRNFSSMRRDPPRCSDMFLSAGCFFGLGAINILDAYIFDRGLCG